MSYIVTWQNVRGPSNPSLVITGVITVLLQYIVSCTNLVDFGRMGLKKSKYYAHYKGADCHTMDVVLFLHMLLQQQA